MNNLFSGLFDFDKFNKSFILQEYYYELDEYNKINDIFNLEITQKKYDKQNYTQVTKYYNKKNLSNITENELYIRDVANRYLEDAGLKQNTDKFVIEYWRHRLFGENNSHKFSKHRDSFGLMMDGINTCIFYLRKDKTFIGGDLEIYGKGDIFRTNKILKTLIPNNNILCFDGDVYHKVTNFNGFGIRDCIVVQFGKEDSLLKNIHF